MELKSGCLVSIHFPESCRLEIINHCERKLAGNTLEGENQDLKAYGLVAGCIEDKIIRVKKCYSLLKNARSTAPYNKIMDDLMARHAIPSETAFKNRGWVVAPDEMMDTVKSCRENGITLLGAYHMHRVGWVHDKLRDTPTELDTILGAESRLIMFIVSMVDRCRPIIRAFYEGKADHELPVIFTES